MLAGRETGTEHAIDRHYLVEHETAALIEGDAVAALRGFNGQDQSMFIAQPSILYKKRGMAAAGVQLL